VACSRCGNFACEDCFGDPRSTLCPPCQEAEGFHPSDLRFTEQQQRMRRWMRKNPRLGGLAFLLGGVAFFLANTASLWFLERYYVIAYPMAGALAGLGLSAIVTGRLVVNKLADAPLGYWIVSFSLAIGGLLAGIGLNFLL
jgi:hypothetical protein